MATPILTAQPLRQGTTHVVSLMRATNDTMSITGKVAFGQNVAIASEIEGTVDSVDLTKTPPEMNIGGQGFTIDKIKRVVRPRA